jgi:hypothetical protein
MECLPLRFTINAVQLYSLDRLGINLYYYDRVFFLGIELIGKLKFAGKL